MIIRPETPADFDSIRTVVATAFKSDVEARLVDDIRADACYRPDWAPPEAGQALPLSAYDPKIRGTAVYPPPFEGLE